MKRRGWRATLTAAVLGAVLVTGRAVAYWAALCDHFEAWRFQLTTQRRPSCRADAALEEDPQRIDQLEQWDLFEQLAAHSGAPVVVASRWRDGPWRDTWPFVWQPAKDRDPLARLLVTLRSASARVTEQRLPKRAYVVVRPPHQSVGRPAQFRYEIH